MDELRKPSMVFYRSFYESISKFPNEVQFLLFRAVIQYGLDLVEPDFSGEALQPFIEAVWGGIRPQLLVNYHRWLNGNNGGCPIGTKKPSMTGNQHARKPKRNQNETEPKPNEKEKENVNENDNVKNDGGIIENWRHLSSSRIDYLRTQRMSVPDFKRSLLLAELNKVADELGLSPADVNAFMLKWGESSPGSDKIRAEYEPTFDVKQRAKNYKGVGGKQKPPSQGDYLDGVYSKKDFTDEEILREFEYTPEIRRQLLRGANIIRKNGKWLTND